MSEFQENTPGLESILPLVFQQIGYLKPQTVPMDRMRLIDVLHVFQEVLGVVLEGC